MRKKNLVFLLLVASTTYAQDYWCLNHHIALDAEYGYMRRSDIRDLPLVKEKKKTVINTDDLVEKMGWESAIRASATFRISACASLEGQFTYYYPWKASKKVDGDENLRLPFKRSDFAFDYEEADKAEATYVSRLQNGELNYWGHVTPQRANYFSFSYLVGLRYMYLRETFQLTFRKGTDKSDYKIKATNQLVGPQLGFVFEVNPTRCFSWLFQIKGAGFLNSLQNDTFLGDENNTIILRDFTKERWTDSWLIEGYGQLAYHIWPSLSIHVGYTGFILTGVALAPEQRDIRTSNQRFIEDKGQIVIDGGRAGITRSF